MDLNNPRYRLATAARISATEGHAEEQFVAMIQSCDLKQDELDFAVNRFKHYRSCPSAQGPKYRVFIRRRGSPKNARHGAYIRAGTLSLEEVFDRMRNRNPWQVVLGVKANFHSWRLRCYEAKGVTCVACGLAGSFFAVEKAWAENTDKYHLNLYHRGDDGRERMMTVDHILPKSRGGGNDIGNLQPMCSSCNLRKGDKCEPETAARDANG